MKVLKHVKLPIRTQNDIVIVRREVKAMSLLIGFRVLEQTKIVTAASELARNTLDYGLGGDVDVESLLNDASQSGLRMIFADQGPGIADIELALTDGYTSGKGLGLGLSGSKRLMSEFYVESQAGKGTRVTVIRWK